MSETNIFRSGGMTRDWNNGRSRVSKIRQLSFGSIDLGSWRAEHPVLGAKVFQTWREAMDYASSRVYMMNAA